MKTTLPLLLLALLCGRANLLRAADGETEKKSDAPATSAADAKPAETKAGTEKKADSDKKPADTTKKGEENFEEGRKLFFQGDYAGAITRLGAAVNADPEKIAYKLLLAKAYRYADQTDKAIRTLEEILKANADHVEAGVELSELLSPQKQPDRVIAVLEPLLKFRHDYPLFHLLAEAYWEKQDFDKARKNYEEAIKLNPRGAEDHVQVGNIYLMEKRFAKAAGAYEAAGALGYATAVYHYKLASVYFNLHNYLGNVQTAEVRGGQPGEIKNSLFLIDRLPGTTDSFYVASPKSAIYQAVKARLAGIKDDPQLRFLEANIWLSARRYPQAEAIYKELQDKIKAADAGLFWYSWAQAALGLDDYENYLSRLHKAIASEPEVYKATLADAYVSVATRHHQHGDSAKYIEYLQKAVSTNPLSARLHLVLGDAFWLENERPKALEQYKLVLELEPDNAQRVRLLNRIRGQEETTGATPAGE